MTTFSDSGKVINDLQVFGHCIDDFIFSEAFLFQVTDKIVNGLENGEANHGNQSGGMFGNMHHKKPCLSAQSP